MASESERIRQIMDLLEGTGKPRILNEGWVQNLRDKLGASKAQKLGNQERAQMADRLYKEYYKWLGQANRPGTMDDMERFMTVRIGFTDDDVDEVLGPKEEVEDDATEAPEASEPKAEAPSEKEWDEEEGVPVPDDLNAKLSDYAKYGVKAEKNDNKVEKDEKVVANPKNFKLPNGEFDMQKVRAQLDKMPVGAKLTLGQNTFSRSTSKDSPFHESIMEADEGDTDVLSRQEVKDIMDASAARINDEYLLNGPKNDQAAVAADAAQQIGGRKSSYGSDKGKMPSGQYDPKEIIHTLTTELEVPRTHITSMTNHVAMAEKTGKGYGRMTKSDQELLAKIGYAFLKSRT